MVVRFQTNRLILEQINEKTDPADFFPIFNGNPDFIGASESVVGKYSYELSDIVKYLWQESVRENSICLAIQLEETGQIIGTAAFLDPNPTDQQPWIGLLLMDSDYQSQGLGAEAAKAIEQYFMSEGREEVRLNVLQNNPKARKFWERLGYVVVAERQDDNHRSCWFISKKFLRESNNQQENLSDG
jgi:RimJ/RimL family protein N-acetyltransferase